MRRVWRAPQGRASRVFFLCSPGLARKAASSDIPKATTPHQLGLLNPWQPEPDAALRSGTSRACCSLATLPPQPVRTTSREGPGP